MKSIYSSSIKNRWIAISIPLFFAVVFLPGFVFGQPDHTYGVGGINNDLGALREKIEQKRQSVEKLEQSIAGFKEKITKKGFEPQLRTLCKKK